MDGFVTLNNTKENVLGFDLEIQGLNTSDIFVKFIIVANEMELCFKAVKDEGNKWSVTIPPLTIIEKSAYPYKVDVVADGYYFQAMEGTVNVVGTAQLYVSTPKNQKLSPPVTKPSVKPKAEEEEVKVAVATPAMPVKTTKAEPKTDKKADEKAKSVVKKEEKKEEKKEVKESISRPFLTHLTIEPTYVDPELKKKSEAAERILSEAGFTTSKHRATRRFSLKNKNH